MNGPKFSVVMPMHNGLPYVKKALESVIAQEYPAHEVIVVDDGSTDESPALVQSYGARVRYHRIDPSGSPAQPKNVGIDMATGDFIAFLDHDDVWFKDKLKKIAGYILKYPNVGFFCSNYAVRYAHLGFRIRRHFSLLPNRRELNFDAPLVKDPFEALLKGNFVGTPSGVVVRRDVTQKAGSFMATHGPCDDYSYWFRCARETEFLLLSDVLFYKRTHATNLSNDAVNILRHHRTILEDLKRSQRTYLDSHGLAPVICLALARCCYDLGNAAFEAGRPLEAFTHYGSGLSAYPRPANVVAFFFNVLKKLGRFLTFDLLSRKTLTRGRR